MANNAKVNYNDKRFTEVEKDEKKAVQDTTNTYNSMINQSESYYQQQIDASKDWADKQSELQQAQTDFTIEKIDQAKDQAKKDYTKEQKGAYTDYQKATNEYGANAEQLASQGLNQTGYSESTRTNAFNTYQNRYVAARESYNQAILNYDNSIKEAQLANSSALATIAYEALQKQLELSLQGFQYKNTLITQKLDAINKEKDRYYQRYQDVLSQINTENSMAEQIRQYNETMKFNKAKQKEEVRQYNESLAFQKSEAKRQQSNWEKEYALSKKKVSSSGGSSGSTKLTNTSKKSSKKSSSSSSNKVTNTSKNKTTKTSSTKLSQTAIKVKQAALTIKNTSTGMINKSSQFAADYLADAYNKGKISDSELKKIASDLGLK